MFFAPRASKRYSFVGSLHQRVGVGDTLTPYHRSVQNPISKNNTIVASFKVSDTCTETTPIAYNRSAETMVSGNFDNASG